MHDVNGNSWAAYWASRKFWHAFAMIGRFVG